MQIGFIGLGKMGQNMVTRLLTKGIDVVVYNRTREITENFKFQISLRQHSGQANLKLENQIGELKKAYELTELTKNLEAPRVIWLMVSAGGAVDEMIDQLQKNGLASGDTLIDGGNSFYKDSVRRYNLLNEKGINFIDCGTSGGLEGGINGASLMLGGDEAAVTKLEPLWRSMAPEEGFAYFGPSGAGHFVKMVHNGIEYGMDQALGEGFEILSQGPYKADLARTAKVWNHGSVIRSWLLELLGKELSEDPGLKDFSGKVGGGQSGKWALETAKELKIDVPVLEKALEARVKSQTNPTFSSKVVSALRKAYGGHGEKS